MKKYTEESVEEVDLIILTETLLHAEPESCLNGVICNLRHWHEMIQVSKKIVSERFSTLRIGAGICTMKE